MICNHPIGRKKCHLGLPLIVLAHWESLCATTWIFLEGCFFMDGVWGALQTPSLRDQTAPELEDAGAY